MALARALLVALLLAGCFLTACGADEQPEKGAVTQLTISVTDPSPGRFRYFAPRSVRGGVVEIRFTNAGRVPHKAQLWRVGRGHTVKQALRRRRPLPGWLTSAGGVGLTAPDATATATQRLEPGTYYVAGAGNERGTVAQIRVTAARSAGRLPAARGRLTTVDYGFRVSGLREGRNRVEFRNRGKQPHHAFFAPMRRGASLADVRAFLSGKATSPPPVSYEDGAETAVFDGGGRQVTDVRLRAGRYALLCFVSDRAGGPPHTQKGMIAEVRVR